MDRLLSIGEASKLCGVTITTLRRWEVSGLLVPERTVSGHRRYLLSQINEQAAHANKRQTRKTIAYARVSSQDQTSDLEKQKNVLEMYCEAQGWTYEVIAESGSGMSFKKTGLKRLLTEIIGGGVGRLVITNTDRLLRFGAELVFAICEAKEVEVLIINKGEDVHFEEDLTSDFIEMIAVFSARLYGSRSPKNKEMLEAVKLAVTGSGLMPVEQSGTSPVATDAKASE